MNGQTYKIYSSDLIRAKQTAKPLARYMGVEIEYFEKLREHNMGEAVGKSREWAKENSLPTNSFDDRSFHGAESWREFWDRVTDLCQDIILDEAENIILVSHGGIVAVWYHIWIGSNIHYCKFGPAGGVSFFSINDSGERSIQKLNDISYMEEA